MAVGKPYTGKRHQHRMKEHPLYTTWQTMRRRCYSPKEPDYKHYGGRGITMCSRWGDFSNFAEDMGPKPSGDMTVERRDNEEGYSPDNCYWLPATLQHLNRRKPINQTDNPGIRKICNSYRARIWSNGGYKHIGTYGTLQEAVIARMDAELFYRGSIG